MTYYNTIEETFGSIRFRVVFEDCTEVVFKIHSGDSDGFAYFNHCCSQLSYKDKDNIINSFALAMIERYCIYVDKQECLEALENAYINETITETEEWADNRFLVRC